MSCIFNKTLYIKIKNTFVEENLTKRKPIFAKKKTVTSAGNKFEALAVKKAELVEIQKKISEEKLLQQREEHDAKMQLLKLKKEILEKGSLTFEF